MRNVPRRIAYVAVWVAVAAVTTGVSWFGIRSVMNAAIGRNQPLSAAELRRIVPDPESEVPAAAPSSGAPSVRPNASPTPAETWTPTADGKGGTAFKRTFQTVGGDVVVWSAKGDVQVQQIVPKTGYTVNVTRYGPDSVMISFFGNRKTSRVWSRWWAGPFAEVTESVS
jgi:hypothetical protein